MDERQKQLEREREEKEKNKTLEERFAALEAQNQNLVSSNERLLEESKKNKDKSKTLEAEMAREESEKRIAKEEKLREQGQYKELLKQREDDLAAEKLKTHEESLRVQNLSKTLSDAQKLSAFENRLGGVLENPQYLQFVDTEKIIINPETNKIDVNSVDAVVKDFLSNHKSLVKFGGGKFPNGQGGNGGGKIITHQQWNNGNLKSMTDNFEAAFKANNKS